MGVVTNNEWLFMVLWFYGKPYIPWFSPCFFCGFHIGMRRLQGESHLPWRCELQCSGRWRNEPCVGSLRALNCEAHLWRSGSRAQSPSGEVPETMIVERRPGTEDFLAQVVLTRCFDSDVLIVSCG